MDSRDKVEWLAFRGGKYEPVAEELEGRGDLYVARPPVSVVQLIANKLCPLGASAGDEDPPHTNMLERPCRQPTGFTCAHDQHCLVSQVAGVPLDELKSDR